jgi:hypothetical protein
MMDYTFTFESSKTAESIFEILLDVRQWWVGLYGEEIIGNSKNLHDEFSFRAGDGMHYSKQRLIELVPDSKITWKVVESNLSFIKNTDEWTNTNLGFEIIQHKHHHQVVFTHQGLTRTIECYQDCSGAWNLYLQNLAEKLK